MNRIELKTRALSLNVYYRIMRGRYIISPKGREYKKLLQDELTRLEIKPTNENLKLTVTCHFTKNLRRDIDNVCKGLFDALKNFLYEDDSQIFELLLIKKNGQDEDKIIIQWEFLTNH